MRKVAALRSTWVLAILFSALLSTVKGQLEACSIQGIDLGLCLNQDNATSFSIDSTCCKMLNKLVRTGYSCLCLLAASSLPLINSPLSLPLSTCYISAPPLTICRVIAPLPIDLPPNMTDEIVQPSVPPENLLLPPPPPPPEMQAFLNSTGKDNSTMMQTSSPSPQNPVTEPSLSKNETESVSNGRDITKTMLFKISFLSLAIHSFIH